MLFTFLKSHYDPSRMVLAGVGVEHDALVECAQKYLITFLFFKLCLFKCFKSFRYFEDRKPVWMENNSLVLPGRREVDRSVAQYTGGLVQVKF